jgi:cell division septum initiation protein DivIVA
MIVTMSRRGHPPPPEGMPAFTMTLRGYSRVEVEAYVRDLQSALRAAEQRVAELERRLGEGDAR